MGNGGLLFVVFTVIDSGAQTVYKRLVGFKIHGIEFIGKFKNIYHTASERVLTVVEVSVDTAVLFLVLFKLLLAY